MRTDEDRDGENEQRKQQDRKKCGATAQGGEGTGQSKELWKDRRDERRRERAVFYLNKPVIIQEKKNPKCNLVTYRALLFTFILVHFYSIT